MIFMMTTTTNLQYARVEHTSEYPDQFNESGLIIIWRNPYYRNGESQLNRWVYPITAEGFQLASKDALRGTVKPLYKNIFCNVNHFNFFYANP